MQAYTIRIMLLAIPAMIFVTIGMILLNTINYPVISAVNTFVAALFLVTTLRSMQRMPYWIPGSASNKII